MKENIGLNKLFAVIGMALVGVLLVAGMMLPLTNVTSQTTGAEDEDDDAMRTITANGLSEISVAPEKVDIYVSVFTDSLKARDSQAENANTSQKVINALVAAGVPKAKIETTSYSLQELTEYNQLTYKYDKKGYRTTNSLKIELSNINDAGKIIDAAIAGGANRVDNIVFGLTDATQAKLKLQALENASADSLDKAKAMAAGVGVEVVQLETMSEQSSYYYPVYRSFQESADSAGGAPAPTEILAGDIKVSANVSATYSIE